MSQPGRALLQASPGAPLRLGPSPDLSFEAAPRPLDSPPDGAALLEVVACCPSAWDLTEVSDRYGYPRVPGNVVAGRDRAGHVWLCSGMLPCGECAPCQVGLHLACGDPARPGWSLPGGLASAVDLPRRAFLAPALAESDAPLVVALLAAAGSTYQAAASANMAPGDTVVVWGPAGPGALPLRLLVELGLRPLWVAPAGSDAPPGVVRLDAAPSTKELPTLRCHILDLLPGPGSIATWLPLLPGCLSCSLIGPELRVETPPLAALLAGQATVRWLRDLHPHLALDVAAMAGRMATQLQPFIERCSLDDLPASFAALARGDAKRWPVLVRPDP